MKRFGHLALILAVAAHAAPAQANFDWAGHVALDAEGLTSPEVTRRIDAVNALAKYDVALTQPYLMAALDDKEERVRVAAAGALGLGRAPAVVPRMIAWLTDPEPKLKQTAADVLGDVGGPAALTALVRSLGDSDSTVRMHAVKALGEIGKRGEPSVVTALIPRLEDDKADVRIATIAQLEELGDRRAVIPLVARFGDTAPEARRSAVRAIGKLGDASATPALIRLVGDPNEDVRTAAVGALGQLRAVDAIDALTEQLSTGGETYRQKVAYALGQISADPRSGKAGEDAMKTLVANLESPATRNAAKEALHVAGKAAVPALVAHLQGRIHGEPAAAIGLLTDAADPRATAALTAELERGRVPIPLVLKALGATGDGQALVPVLGTLSSKDPVIRLAAMEALRPLLGSDARAGDVLLDHLADPELEVRVLAAEDLGALGIGAAAGALTALAGPGNPPRLRHAAIDALGDIARAGHLPAAATAAATKGLLGVLREGPAELHASAATSLSYLAEPQVLAQLVQLARVDRGPTRFEVVRAIGASLRGKPDADPAARTLLRELAEDANVRVALAAIAGLAAAGAPQDAPMLRAMVERAAADRRRAAAWALGEMHDAGAVPALSAAIASKDDRLAGDAAWALGELCAGDPKRAAADGGAAADRWLYAMQHGGWAAAIDSAAGLARALWAMPPPARAALLTPARREALTARLFHKSRLVRINLAHALAAIGDAGAGVQLAQLFKDDPSPHVRIAAARALQRLPDAPAAAAALKAAASDPDPSVRAAARAAPPALPPRSEWRTFYVVDPGADDARVRQEPYFVATPDELIWASYTDARGELTTEHIPAETSADDVLPASREPEY